MMMNKYLHFNEGNKGWKFHSMSKLPSMVWEPILKRITTGNFSLIIPCPPKILL